MLITKHYAFFETSCLESKGKNVKRRHQLASRMKYIHGDKDGGISDYTVCTFVP